MTDRTNEILDWAETIGGLFHLVPDELRPAVLAEIVRVRREYESRPRFRAWSFSELERVHGPPRNWHGRMKATSHAALALVRSITNNHSTKDADKVLFMQHRGPGSGRLLDYIGDLPSLNRKKRGANAA